MQLSLSKDACPEIIGQPDGESVQAQAVRLQKQIAAFFGDKFNVAALTSESFFSDTSLVGTGTESVVLAVSTRSRLLSIDTNDRRFIWDYNSDSSIRIAIGKSNLVIEYDNGEDGAETTRFMRWRK
jgi:hypothetical protein